MVERVVPIGEAKRVTDGTAGTAGTIIITMPVIGVALEVGAVHVEAADFLLFRF